MPPGQQSQTMAKISKSYILTVKCEQPLNKLTVQVWLLTRVNALSAIRL